MYFSDTCLTMTDYNTGTYSVPSKLNRKNPMDFIERFLFLCIAEEFKLKMILLELYKGKIDPWWGNEWGFKV